MGILPAFMSMNQVCAWCLGGQKRVLSPGTEVTDSCAPTCGWMLGTEPRSFVRATSTLNR